MPVSEMCSQVSSVVCTSSVNKKEKRCSVGESGRGKLQTCLKRPMLGNFRKIISLDGIEHYGCLSPSIQKEPLEEKKCDAVTSFAMTSDLTYRVKSTLTIPTRGDPTTVSISPDGTLVAVGCADGHVFVWCARSYELFFQASPPVGEGESTEACVVNMTWMSNELLAFSRKNGLVSILLVGKVRASTRRRRGTHSFYQRFIEAVSIAVHDHLPVVAMAYSDTLNCWATATYNEINFVRWKRNECNPLVTQYFALFQLSLLSSGHTFHASPTDRIIAKRVSVSSEEEQTVEVTSLNWMKKSSSVAHLVVSFLHHHVEWVNLTITPPLFFSAGFR